MILQSRKIVHKKTENKGEKEQGTHRYEVSSLNNPIRKFSEIMILDENEEPTICHLQETYFKHKDTKELKVNE